MLMLAIGFGWPRSLRLIDVFTFKIYQFGFSLVWYNGIFFLKRTILYIHENIYNRLGSISHCVNSKKDCFSLLSFRPFYWIFKKNLDGLVLFCFGFFFSSLETVSWRNGVFSPRSPVTQRFSSRWPTPRLFQRCASIASAWPLLWMTECLPFQKSYYFRGIYFSNGEYRIFKVELVTGVISSLIIDPPPGTASLPSLEYHQCGMLFSMLAIFPVFVRQTCVIFW